MSRAVTLPLAGIRVLDLTRLLPGGYASQMLADLGADVIKIEEPGVGDYARTLPPLAKSVGQSFLAVNRNKRSVAINLKHEQGRAVFLRLVDTADVVLESFRPGVMQRLGLAHETLRERNPRLTVCAISGYGQNGPFSQRAGHDLNYIGYAGLLAHLARPGHMPTLPGPQFADIAGGALMAVVGILTALVGRAQSGEGRIVDVSMMEGALAIMPLLTTPVLMGQPELAPGEVWLAGALPAYGVYETSDGRYVTLAALEPKFWETFCQQVGRPDLISHHMPADADDREWTREQLSVLFRTRPRDAWVQAFAEVDACVGPVNTIEEALASPQIRERGVVAPVDFGDEGSARALRTAPAISDVPFAADRGVPALGADTRDILQTAGLTADEISALAATGAIALAD